MLDRQHPRARALRRWHRQKGGAFHPAQLASCWLRLADGTVTGVGYSSVPDILNSNPAVQTTDARRPVNGTSSNGLPIATWSSGASSSLSWPLTAQNNSTTRFHWAVWVKQPTNNQEAIFSISTGTGGASVPKIQFFIEASRRLRADVYMSGANGRFARGAVNDLPPGGTWFFARLFYDSSVGGDGCLKLYVNGLASVLTFGNLGTGPTLGVLPAATGNAVIGNLNNSGTPSLCLNGSLGPNFYILNGPDLTLAEETNLMNFEMPT